MAEFIENKLAEEITPQDKVISLFKFIHELNKLKQKTILNITDYPWSSYISNYEHDPENIKVYYRNRVESDGTEDASDTVLLSIRKPEYDRCPEPDASFADWLEPGWNSFKEEPTIKKHLSAENNPEQSEKSFDDDPTRVRKYNEWIAERKIWADKQKEISITRKLFTDLYSLYFILQRESETLELIVANGFLRDKDNVDVNHPVLTKRVKLHFNPAENILTIKETDMQPELYSAAFQALSDINRDSINELQTDLQKNDYHPLDRNDTPDFLKVMVHQLSSESKYFDSEPQTEWQNSNRLIIFNKPCYILRKRLDGTAKAIEQIIENIQDTGFIPAPIIDIVSGGKIDLPDDTVEESVEEQLASVGGESVDVLLSKEANKEQLEIAKRIEKHNAVLVQGPPGTGKTHTIANLMGHFLSQGKSVLITSHTPKALSVLKDKLVPGIQNLCVSMIDDSNTDMERSIDGISDYMSRNTSYELKRSMDRISLERKDVIRRLADTRRKMFSAINAECKSIIYNGEEFSPSSAAAFVFEHAEDLSYIPGKIKVNSAIPISYSELVELYRSNELITVENEDELATNLPEMSDVLQPDDFVQICNDIRFNQNALNEITLKSGCQSSFDAAKNIIEIHKNNRNIQITKASRATINAIKTHLSAFGKIDEWMKYAAVDGKNGGSFVLRWNKLIEQIIQTCELSEKVVEECFGKDISIHTENHTELIDQLKKLTDIYSQKGKVSKLTLALHKDIDRALKNITISGHSISSEEECKAVLHFLELESYRKQCALYWDELLSSHSVPNFFDLHTTDPERIAYNWIGKIQYYLNWYNDIYNPFMDSVKSAGISVDSLFEITDLDSDIDITDKILTAVDSILPALCDICTSVIKINVLENELQQRKKLIQTGKRINSGICQLLSQAISDYDVDAYLQAYKSLELMHDKYRVQNQRNELILRLKEVAPQWAEAIHSRRGIHGESILPDSIYEAWKWKQLSAIIEDIASKPYADLLKESVDLSKEYRRITAEYAEKSAWYHLIRKTEGDIDMKHALEGWKQTVKKIGKGTGKRAPELKAKARELMSKCQRAVPSWIMPINRALENLNPKENRFDVIIIDEASQSDVSALSILYMAEKLIIVGDDKQVSPMAVGVESDKMTLLQEMYINNKIPNSHLYDAKTSVYDIAKTTFQPLMLREHFRCVPEIISFSNYLSYDFKIKPLRDSSESDLIPAVVNHRVKNGVRTHNKTNPKEAQEIVSLIMACLEQEEYNGKTFGIISLLGDEQVKLIQRLVEMKIQHKDIIERDILCGNASNFQGDERDVIFLSIVDSAEGDGPLPLKAAGVDDSVKKRYNVAVSRAKDQLWVVNSLDASVNLKPGDLRKLLIDFACDPSSLMIKNAEIEEKSESPFEASVAKALTSKGFKIEHQWKVGAYRIDLVAVYDNKAIAIECDGERYHSGDAKIREDMERQTILERLGWRFIRIRGSEYYRDPEKTIARVVGELQEYGIQACAEISSNGSGSGSDLLERVRNRAAVILAEHFDSTDDDAELVQTTSYALAANAQDTKVKTEPVVKNPIQKKRNSSVDDTAQLTFEDMTSFSATIKKPKEKSSAKSKLKPTPQPATPKPKTDLPKIDIGTKVFNKTWGEGTIVSKGLSTIVVRFNRTDIRYSYPISFQNGTLTIK